MVLLVTVTLPPLAPPPSWTVGWFWRPPPPSIEEFSERVLFVIVAVPPLPRPPPPNVEEFPTRRLSDIVSVPWL